MLAFCTAGAESLRMTVMAVPLTAVGPAVAVGLANPAPDAGVCHDAATLLPAVSTWPVVGAVAALTTTVVVAEIRPFVAPDVSPAAVPVRLVATPDAGVPNAGVTRAGLVARTTDPLPVVDNPPRTPALL